VLACGGAQFVVGSVLDAQQRVVGTGYGLEDLGTPQICSTMSEVYRAKCRFSTWNRAADVC